MTQESDLFGCSPYKTRYWIAFGVQEAAGCISHAAGNGACRSPIAWLAEARQTPCPQDRPCRLPLLGSTDHLRLATVQALPAAVSLPLPLLPLALLRPLPSSQVILQPPESPAAQSRELRYHIDKHLAALLVYYRFRCVLDSGSRPVVPRPTKDREVGTPADDDFTCCSSKVNPSSFSILAMFLSVHPSSLLLEGLREEWSADSTDVL